MKKKIFLIFLVAVLFVASAIMVGCAKGGNDGTGEEPGQTEQPGGDTEGTDDGEDEGTGGEQGGETVREDLGESVDLVLFIGQSNMAGRGVASEATVVGEGHGFEFRAISDPTKLYPIEEPFGVNENNPESGVNENKKTGSMVSAICESYYQTTGTPIVAVSCSQGGTGINFWDTNRPAYEDACERMLAAKEYLYGDDDYKLRNTFVVWLQGEHDGGNGVTAQRYTKTLANIFDAFKADIDADNFFVIPIGGIKDDEATQANYTVIRQAQMDFCDTYEDAVMASVQLMDMFEYGYLKDNVHYTQDAYNKVGEDVGANMGYFVQTGNKPQCSHYELELSQYNEGAAWNEEGGRVVIPAYAAFENSPYASASSRYNNNDTLYYWQAVETYNGGVRSVPDTGANWNTGTGYERAPQLNYVFYINDPGTYYLYMMTSFPDTEANSILACVDGEPMQEWAMSSYGNAGRWYGGTSGIWFDIEEVGEHTLTICPREDGVVLHQFMLSKDSAESLTWGETQTESERLPIVEKGAYVEKDGIVSIDLVSALESSEYSYYKDGTDTANGVTSEYYWQRSGNGSGVQIMPKGGNWSSSDDLSTVPYVSYTVDFTKAGTYYVFLYVTFLNAESDSAMIAVDDGRPLELTLLPNSTGKLRWLTGDAWTIEIAQPGVHTITLYAREGGAAMHKLVLAQDASYIVGAQNPPASPRVTLNAEDPIQEKDGVAVIGTDVSGEYAVEFLHIDSYHVYAYVTASAGATLQVGGNTVSFAEAFEGWRDCGMISVETAGEKIVSCSVTGSVQVKYIYLASEEAERVKSIETLVIGDSYTSKTYWTNFDEQMAPVGGLTIGVSGSEADMWLGRVKEMALYNPENIVIHIGVNDINRGESGTSCGEAIATMIENITQILPDTKIFYVAICNNNSHANDGKWSQYAVSNGIVEALAEESADDNIYYIDFNTAMSEAGKNMENKGFSGDNLHMNSEGYALFSQMIVDAIRNANGEVN